MTKQTIINCLCIFFGSVIMLISIRQSKGLLQTMVYVAERQRKHIHLYLRLHRGLMTFFFCGYLVVLIAFAFHYPFISETFVSLIFLFGAIFVFIGILVQSRLLSEVQHTLHGILPICCKCKKIRVEDVNHGDKPVWKGIEDFFSERTDLDFSHGYCPKCYEDEMKKIN